MNQLPIQLIVLSHCYRSKKYVYVCNTFCPFAKVTLLAEILYPFFSYPPQLYFLFILFIFFGHTVRHTELPQPGIKPVPPSVEAWNLNP